MGFIHIQFISSRFGLARVDDDVTQLPSSFANPLGFGSLALVISTLWMLISLSTINLRLFSLPWTNNPLHQYQIYREYLSSRDYSTQSINKFLGFFNAEGGRIKYILCHGEETPTLAPFLELMKSNVDPDNSKVCATLDRSGGTQSTQRIISLP